MRRLSLVLSSALIFGSVSSAMAVDAKSALSKTIPSIKLDSVAFKDAIDFIQDLSTANVHVNWKALETAGVDKTALIDLHLHGVPLYKALDIILSEASGGNSTLTYTIEDNVIEITTREIADHQLVTIIYPVDDLLMDVPDFAGPTFDISQQQSGGSVTPGSGGGGSSSSGSGMFGSGGSTSDQDSKPMTRQQRAQELIDLITSIVRPDVWSTNGGPASIRFFNGNLIVTAPRSVQDALE